MRVKRTGKIAVCLRFACRCGLRGGSSRYGDPSSLAPRPTASKSQLRVVMQVSFCCAAVSVAVVSSVALGSGSARAGSTVVSVVRTCVPSWKTVPSGAERTHQQLVSVSARNPYDAWAVGQRYVEHWNGATWRIVPASRGGGLFHDVTEVSDAEAWAVGEVGRSALIERWDGRQWRRIQLGRPVAHARAAVGERAGRVLQAVSGIDATNVWAVGWDERTYTAAQQRNQMLIHPQYVGVVLHWDGRAWKEVPLPRRFVYDRPLNDLAVTPGGAVWVVGEGSYTDQNGGAAIRWDGKRWKFYRLTGPAGDRGGGIQCGDGDRPDSVAAVGVAGTTPGHLDGEAWGLFYRFDKGRWTTRVPDYHGSSSSFDAVAARSPREVWIADNDADPFNFAEGTQLFTGRHPKKSARSQLGQGQVIHSLAADSAGIWAVGGTGSGQADQNDNRYAHWQPLIARYSC